MPLLSALVVVSMLSQDLQQSKVAVSDFQAPTGQASLGVMLSGMVGHELARLELFKVTTAEQVRTVLSVERQKQLLGCVDEACGNASAAASLLGVDLLVTGRLTRLAGKKDETTLLTLDLTLLDAGTGQRKGSQMVKAASESEIVNQLPAAVLALVGKVLEGRQGALVLQASETGAAVKIDGTQVGTTPLEGRLLLAAGPHLLRVEKESFVAAQRQVRIVPDGVTQETVALVPSPDFVQAYEQRESRFLVGTWAAAGVGVAGVATFVAMQLRANALYGSVDQVGSFAYHRQALLNGLETEGSGDALVDHRQQAGALKAQIETAQRVGFVAGGLGLAAGITSVTLAILSDDPGKYRQYRTATRATAWLAPSGAGFALGGAF